MPKAYISKSGESRVRIDYAINGITTTELIMDAGGKLLHLTLNANFEIINQSLTKGVEIKQYLRSVISKNALELSHTNFSEPKIKKTCPHCNAANTLSYFYSNSDIPITPTYKCDQCEKMSWRDNGGLSIRELTVAVGHSPL